MFSDRLSRLFRPRRIAAIGGRWAEEVVRQCHLAGYSGEVWRINPKKAAAEEGIYATIADLPAVPDVAFVAINSDQSLETVRQLAAIQCGGVVCFAAGFSEIGNDNKQQQLLDAAGDMPLLGPNCYGFLNYLDGALLWPDQHGGKAVDSGVAILSQSGNIAISLTMQNRGLPLAFICTLGNQASLGFAEIGEHLLSDPRITAIGWIIEGSGNPRNLESFLRKARDCKPVVALKLGTSRQGAAAALSHTATLAGETAGFDALIRRYGATRVETLPNFLETLKLLDGQSLPAGEQILSLSCSGGEAALMADRLEQTPLVARRLNPEEEKSLREVLGDRVILGNPLDYHTFIWGNAPALQSLFEAALGGGFHTMVLVMDFPRPDCCDDRDWQTTLKALYQARAKHPRPVCIVTGTLPENIPEALVREAAAQNITMIGGIDETLAALVAATEMGKSRQTDMPPLLLTNASSANTEPFEPETIQEDAGKRRLSSAGIRIPAGETVGTVESALEAAKRLGYPVVAKATGVAHKTESDAVRINLRQESDLAEAARQLLAAHDKLLIEEMIEGSLFELIVGVRRDQWCGLLMTLGSGGIWTEIFSDTAHLPLPTDAATVRQALSTLRARPLWRGYRGRPAVDENLLIDTILRIAAFAETIADNLQELDINPLILTEKNVVVADILLILKQHQNQRKHN